jgi:hypothetical protein
MYQATSLRQLCRGASFRINPRKTNDYRLDGYDSTTRTFVATAANGEQVNLRPRRKIYAPASTYV